MSDYSPKPTSHISPRWLAWGRELQAAAQNGLTYSTNPFDIERYKAIRNIAAEMMAEQSGENLQYVRNLFEGELGHATPKVDVRGVVFKDQLILLVKERSDGLWTLPGGWADLNESPAEATVREIYEESGFRTQATKLLALYDRDRHGHTSHPNHVYKIFFLCQLLGGIATTSIETEEVGFFPEAGIPPLSIGRVTPTQIARFFDHARHPEWPTDFD